MLTRRRLPLFATFPALYVGIAVVRAGEGRPSAWLLIGIAVLVAWLGARAPTLASSSSHPGEGEPESGSGSTPPPSRLRVWASAGLSVTIATIALETRPAWAALARAVGAGLTMLAGVRAIGAIDGDVGLAPKASDATRPLIVSAKTATHIGAATVLFAWGTVALSDAYAWAHRAWSDGAAVLAAGLGTLAIFALGATALAVGRARGLELWVRPRATACTAAAAAGLVASLALALGELASADGAVALAGATAAAFTVRLARAADPLVLARRLRRGMTLAIFGGPVIGLAAVAVEGRTVSPGAAAVVLALLALAAGALTPVLEESFLPVKGVLLAALADARDATREREVREAMAHALVRLREASAVGLKRATAPSPELWLLHPTRVFTVDAAGYLQERAAELPAEVFDVALGEPYATVRTSVLHALEVRRSDLRPLLGWLGQRRALFATVIAESEDPDGLIVVPQGARTEELTIEEARAGKLLADSFVAVCQATSAKARHLARELELKGRIDTLDDEVARLKHAIDLDVGRHVLASTRLARPATVGIYSAVSRMAYADLERRIGQEAPTLILARGGIDPVPYVARAHLAGPRKGAPLVVVDATSSREHDLDRWTDEKTSPIALADRGLLFLVDGAALPREVQVLIARAVAERRTPWERASPLDVAVAMSATLGSAGGIDDLISSGRLSPELAARFESGDAIALPGLAERPEDLHSIVADRLAREGLRLHGRPVGIDAAAFARLIEYPFTGEDAELASIVTKLVALATDDVVRAANVDAIGLPPRPPTESERESSPQDQKVRRIREQKTKT